ncbi:MAG: SDR family NAD(P)-dependent oxidoreductase [Saprospiraceae bacterium]|nr:SDR family NAD(P)-dependent oxidoreductase [Saprospiraceae bacterium]
MSGNHETYALITGASRGLGRAFAFELAKQNANLILVALPNEGLAAFASQLGQRGVNVHFFETDLSKRENVEALAATVNQSFALNVLVNNAGRGGTRRMEEAEPHYIDGILQLNIVATALLTRLLLANLRQQGSAWILNVSSMAAFSPIGFKTVYPASKAFIRHFSLGLREELKGTGVSVSIVYPGPMKTNSDVTQRIEDQGIKGRIGLLSPEAVASVALREMLAGKANIIPGFGNKLNRWLMGLLPEKLVIKLVSRAVLKEL